jgi:hypothetical protein
MLGPPVALFDSRLFEALYAFTLIGTEENPDC